MLYTYDILNHEYFNDQTYVDFYFQVQTIFLTMISTSY